MDVKTDRLLNYKETIGYFLYDCLSKEGITEILGVPGDYNFSLLNVLEQYQGINFVNCCNELNAGYAADAYARVKGLSALITTFGVGELSACNAIAGAYSESVPIIHIVGGPKTVDEQEHKLMHHSLLDGDFDVFRKVYEHITESAVTITAENAAIEIPRAIKIAKETKKTVYLLFAMDIVSQPIMRRDSSIENKQTEQKSLQAAIQHIEKVLTKAQKPMLISGVYVSRFNLKDLVGQVVDKMNLPVTTMMMGKGSFDESHKNYIGLYSGSLGSKEVQNIVQAADCILAVGTMWSDYNTGSFTAKLNPLNIIEIQPTRVKVGMAVYEDIILEDLLKELLTRVDKRIENFQTVSFPYDNAYNSLDERVSSKYYYPRFQKMFKENDIIIADSGTFQFGIAELKLPKGATYIAQGGWGSIGFGIPAAFGACIADKSRRTILFVGDGASQMTFQEVSSMLHNNCKPIIFLVNNKEYTIEKYLNISEKHTCYNDIPLWDFSKLLEVFGGDFYAAKAYTNKELDEAIKQAEVECSEKLCLIEIYAPQMDVPDVVHKMTNVLEEKV